MAISGARYAIATALSRGLALENPFHRRTRQATAYDRLKAGLLASRERKDLPLARQMRVHRLILVHMWLADSDAAAIVAHRLPAEFERYLAYSNLLNRLASSLEGDGKTGEADVDKLVAEVMES